VYVYFHFQGLLIEEKYASFFFTGIIKTPTPQKNNHYDTPKIYNEAENIVSKSKDNMEKIIINDKVRMHSLYVDDSSFFFSLCL
jgi:hypothetical protein